jgi:hypothetical protein
MSDQPTTPAWAPPPVEPAPVVAPQAQFPGPPPVFAPAPVPADPAPPAPVDVPKGPVDDPNETWIVYRSGFEPPDSNGFQAPIFKRVTSDEYKKLGL